jgi:methenyltetrahydrofolate cyclohydrolase
MSGAEASPAYLDMGLGRFLDALSATTPDPGGGSVAALAVTLAAGLCMMTAGLSRRQLPTAEQLAGQARLLRDRAAPLAQADAEAYRTVLAAMRAPGGPGDALSRACATPMEVAEIGADVARIADTVATGGNPNVRGDAITAALLAAAGSRAAAALVRINLATAPGDARPARADQFAVEAARLAAEAEAPLR